MSPDGALFATGGKDNYANVYDLATRKRVQGLKHPGEVNGLAFTPDGKFLATGCTDARIRIFDAKTVDEFSASVGRATSALDLPKRAFEGVMAATERTRSSRSATPAS